MGEHFPNVIEVDAVILCLGHLQARISAAVSGPTAIHAGLGTAGLSSFGFGADAEPTAEDSTAYRAALDGKRKLLPSGHVGVT